MIKSNVGSFCSTSSITDKLIDGSSLTAVCGQPPVAIPMIMSSGINFDSVARVRCILSASSLEITSFEIIQHRKPFFFKIGTSCSIS